MALRFCRVPCARHPSSSNVQLWLLASRHYIERGEPRDHSLVLSSSDTTLFGSFSLPCLLLVQNCFSSSLVPTFEHCLSYKEYGKVKPHKTLAVAPCACGERNSIGDLMVSTVFHVAQTSTAESVLTVNIGICYPSFTHGLTVPGVHLSSIPRHGWT